MDTKRATATMATFRRHEHENCVVCSGSNGIGLNVEFVVVEDNAVEARFGCDRVFEGYRNMIHGGVISSLVDGAMTNCIFANGYVAFTAELNIRFHRPVTIGEVATVRAWIDDSYRPLHLLKAEVTQNHQVKVTATGKFMERADG